MGSKTAEKNGINIQTDRQTGRHYENNGHLAVNQQITFGTFFSSFSILSAVFHAVPGEIITLTFLPSLVPEVEEVFVDWMPFQLPNQQCQSTEGNITMCILFYMHVCMYPSGKGPAYSGPIR